jgi:nucleotide-binding universal stress UspA family protein
MFDTILWATDGSSCADHALGRVCAICERYCSTLRVVHVVQRHGGRRRPAVPGGTLEDRVIAKLKAQTSALRGHGINASLHVIRGAAGSPACHILEIARTVDADLVIVSSRGRSPLHAGLTGSVTQQLITEAACPVLVLPAGKHPGRQEQVPRRATPATPRDT